MTRTTSVKPAARVRLPDFLIIGAAKAGTTTLYEYLRTQPDFYMCTPKEPDFFVNKYDRGIDWYASLFHDARPDQLCGDASTSYTLGFDRLPDCVQRIAACLPDTRLVYILRHPVERTYSDYCEQSKTAQVLGSRVAFEQTFEEYLEQHPQIIQTSRYIQQINLYLRHYSRDALHVMLLEDLSTQPGRTIQNFRAFLGAKPMTQHQPRQMTVFNQRADQNYWIVRERVVKPLRAIPLVGSLGSRLPKPLRDRCYSMLQKAPYAKRIQKQVVPPPMLPQTRAMLLEVFKKPNANLGNFLGRDLSHWDR